MWKQNVPVLAAEENLKIIEIGSYEGGSSLWFANHALIGPMARLDCIDTWDGSVENDVTDGVLWKRFSTNLAPFLNRNVFAHRGESRRVLPRMMASMGDELYDVAYVDGSHFAKDCLLDLVMVYEMVRVGGYIIIDDYEWNPVS